MHPKEDVPAGSPTPVYLVRTPTWSNWGGPWLMPKPFSIRLRRPTCQALMNPTIWQCMCPNWGRWWNHTFSDCDIFEGLTHKSSEAGVEEAMQPNPTKSTLADDWAILMTAPSALADESATLITTPSIPAKESVTLVTTPSVLVDEPAGPHNPSRGNQWCEES